MQNLGIENERKFWCPRCGTVKTEHASGFEDTQQPMLVGRIKDAHDTGLFLSSQQPGWIDMKYHAWRDVLEAIGIKAP